MTTMTTIEDLLRIVREDAEVRAALRRELLTDEVLELPSQFAAMLETQDRILAELADNRKTQSAVLEDIADLRRIQNSMLETQDRILAELAETRETQNAMLEEQKEARGDIKALHEMYRRQHDAYGRFRGIHAEHTAKKGISHVAEDLAGLRGMRRLRLRNLGTAELSDILFNRNPEALDNLDIRERGWLTFVNADMVVEVTQRNDAEASFYIALESSYTGDQDDLLRATDHAKILRCATGQDAYAVVASVRMAPNIIGRFFNDIAWFFDSGDDEAAFWYQLSVDEA